MFVKNIVPLIFVMFVLSACGGETLVITATPGTPPTMTPPPTSTVDPTPTPEALVNLDCQTLQPTNSEFPAINANPCLRVFDSVLHSEQRTEGRTWDRLDEYAIVYRPGNTGKSPFVYWRDITSPDPRGLRMDVSWVNGEFGYSQNLIYLLPGQRYIIKIEAVSELFDNGGSLPALDARLVYSGGKYLEFQQWTITQRGPVEAFWVVESSSARAVTIEWWVDIQWANVTGNITLQGLRVELAPEGFGDDIVLEF